MSLHEELFQNDSNATFQIICHFSNGHILFTSEEPVAIGETFAKRPKGIRKSNYWT